MFLAEEARVHERVCVQFQRMKEHTHPDLSQPILALVRLLLAEGQFDQLSDAVLSCGEGNHMLSHVAEIAACVGVLARTQIPQIDTMDIR